MTKTTFDSLTDKVLAGKMGRNKGIAYKHSRLGTVLSIRPGIYTAIAGNSGTGKTGYCDDAYVLAPYDWYLNNKDKTDLVLKIIYRSMERPKAYKLAKWCCVQIRKIYGITLTTNYLLGWEDSIADDHLDMFLSCKAYFDEMLESGVVEIIDGIDNPTGIWNHLKKYALERGKVEQVSEFQKKYIPDNPNLLTEVIIDHIGKVSGERGFDDKQTIDKMSEYLSICRDQYNMAPVVISQLNRDIDNVQRKKEGDLEPQLSDLKGSANVVEDADVVLGLFNPYRYKEYNFMNYNIHKMVDKAGNSRFRSLKILKNSYGTDDIRVGMQFIGECGTFKELPHPDQMTPEIYSKVVA